MKYVMDSMVTDAASSSGPHGISLSTTMDDDVFMDGTLREVAEEEEPEKTPDSHDEVSERSMQKVSPGAVREEVSQAIIDKKGTLIILKDSEDRVDSEGKDTSAVGEKEERVEADAKEDDLLSAPKEKEDDTAVGIEAQTTVVKTLSAKIGIKTDNVPQIKGIGSPKKAMASWISEEVKPEATEVISVSVKEVREMMTGNGGGGGLFTFEEVQSKQSSLTQITLSESSASSLAVVLYENLKATTWCWQPPFISPPPPPPPPPPAAFSHCAPP